MASDRRQSFRCAVPEGTGQAVLRIGESTINLQLVNTSAGGYSATCEGTLSARLGDLLPMGTAVGWIEVRIVHIDRQDPKTTLGLERVRELQGPPQRSWMQTVGGRRGIALVAVALLVGLLVGLAGAWIWPKLMAAGDSSPSEPAAACGNDAPIDDPVAPWH